MSTAPVRLTVVSAGLSQPSSTRLLADRLADATALQLREQGHEVEVTVVELRDLAHAVADNLVTGFPGGALREAVEAVTGADGLIAVTPVFSASYSGLFKSFVDVLDNTALTGKPVLIAATGGTDRHSLVLDHALRPLFSYLRAVVVPTGVYAASADWGTAADAHTDDLPTRIARAAAELSDLVGHRPARAAVRPDEAEVVPFAQQLAALRPPRSGR
jgi:FMN reductase